MFRRGRLVLAVLAALTTLALVAAPAGAHANLVRALPSPGTAVDPAPLVVYAEFSEAIDLGYSSLEVLDADGESVTSGPTEADPTSSAAMLVPVADLADGTYVVVWRTLSVVDGHVIRGSFAFGVGEPVAADVAVAVASIQSSPAAAASRGLLFMGVAMLIGAPLQALAQRRGAPPERRRVVERRTALLLLGAGLLALAGQVGLLGTQILILGGDSLLAGFGDVFGAGQWGVLWIARTVALVVALVLADQASSSEVSGRRGVIGFAGVALAGVAMAVTISLGSHAAALIDVAPGLAADLIHLLAVGAWVGGLPVLLLVVWESRRTRSEDGAAADLTEVAARFSAVATVAVGLIVVTGTYSAWLQVLEPSRLWSTDYGVLLLVKLVLVAPLLALGGVNLGWTRPRLAVAGAVGARARKALRTLVVGEIVLAAAVLGVVGFLTEREPARQVSGDVPLAVEGAATSGDASVRVRVVPGRPGPNRLEIEVAPLQGELADTDVELQLRYLDTDLGTTVERPVRNEDGVFAVETDAFTLAGVWQVLAIVRQPGAFDARVPVRLEIGSPTAVGVAEVDTAAAARLWGLALAGMGFVLAVATLARQGWAPRLRRVGTGAGFAAILLGAGLLIIGPQQRVAPSAVNPIPPDNASVSAGREIYEAECVSCHGPAGRGDGPLAATLDPPPLDLVIHVPLHLDDALFGFVFNGIEGTAMPAFGERYGELDTWHIINFIQTLPAAARS